MEARSLQAKGFGMTGPKGANLVVGQRMRTMLDKAKTQIRDSL